MSDEELRGSLLGEEWMALRRIASGGKASEVPLSIQEKLTALGLIAKDHYGHLTLTERGHRIIETPD